MIASIDIGNARNRLKRMCLAKSLIICDALRNSVPFVQFKKHGKHPRRSATFSKVVGSSLQLY